MSNMCPLEQTQTMMIAENQIEQIWANCRPIFGVGVGVFEMVGKNWTSCCRDFVLLNKTNKQAMFVGRLPNATNTRTAV